MKIQVNQRIESLDIVRGFAVFGIFLVNMLSFHSPYFYINPLTYWNNPVDQGFYLFIDIFVQASFYPLFSMLFGYSFILLNDRLNAKGLASRSILLRRFSFLLVIGFIHGVFIWYGDILFTYALFAFILLFFHSFSKKGILLSGVISYAIIHLFFIVLLFSFSPNEGMAYDQQGALSSLEAYQYGSIIEIFQQRWIDWKSMNNIDSLLVKMPVILPFFLIGAGMAKYKWVERASELYPRMKKIGILLFGTGFFIKLTPYLFENNLAFTYIQDYLGGPVLAAFYGLTIVLVVEKRKQNRLLRAFSYVGKMSFSNYLLQSIVGTFLFYHYGFGLYGKVSVWAGSIFVMLIYIGQIYFSKWWLSHYSYGPAEWIWRCVTYGERQKLIRNSTNPIKKHV